MRTIGIGEINAIQAYVANADTIIRHPLYKHFRRNSCRAVCLHVVEVAMKEAADVRHEGNDLRQFAHIEMVDAKRNVLLCIAIGRSI